MRELRLLAAFTLVVLLGVALGFVVRRPPATPPAPAPAPAKPVTPAPTGPVTTVQRAPSPPEPVPARALPEADHGWQREDKDKIIRHVKALPASDVDFLCLVLELIPRDEVFDKVNVKGRLLRHVDRLADGAGFADLEAAFRQLERQRSRTPHEPMRP